MPRHDVKRGVVHFGVPQLAAILVHQVKLFVHVFVRGDGREEVPRVGQPVGADGAQVRQLKVPVEHLQDVPTAQIKQRVSSADTTTAQQQPDAPCRFVDSDGKLHATLDDANLTRLDVQNAKLGADVQLGLLRHCDASTNHGAQRAWIKRRTQRQEATTAARTDQKVAV